MVYRKRSRIPPEAPSSPAGAGGRIWGGRAWGRGWATSRERSIGGVLHSRPGPPARPLDGPGPTSAQYRYPPGCSRLSLSHSDRHALLGWAGNGSGMGGQPGVERPGWSAHPARGLRTPPARFEALDRAKGLPRGWVGAPTPHTAEVSYFKTLVGIPGLRPALGRGSGSHRGSFLPRATTPRCCGSTAAGAGQLRDGRSGGLLRELGWQRENNWCKRNPSPIPSPPCPGLNPPWPGPKTSKPPRAHHIGPVSIVHGPGERFPSAMVMVWCRPQLPLSIQRDRPSSPCPRHCRRCPRRYCRPPQPSTPRSRGRRTPLRGKKGGVGQV